MLTRRECLRLLLAGAVTTAAGVLVPRRVTYSFPRVLTALNTEELPFGEWWTLEGPPVGETWIDTYVDDVSEIVTLIQPLDSPLVDYVLSKGYLPRGSHA